MENRELKPCPFCGSKNLSVEPYKSRKGYECTIQCNGKCILYMQTITYDTEEEAVEKVINDWNRRANDEHR